MFMDLGIAGRWALVCGASKGLGLGCAQSLVRAGVNVVMVARGSEALEQSAIEMRAAQQVPMGAGGRNGFQTEILTVPADITTPQGRAAVFALRADFDIVVTNAGGPPPGDFRSWDREAWLKAVDANMLTPIELIRATVDGMAARGFGRIVNITSSAVKAPIDILGLSNGARSGLTGFVPAWRAAASPRRASPSTTCCPALSIPTACAAPWRVLRKSPARVWTP
jgi:3-oxoacyl-[acyl-carrier protein] reductase